MLNFGQPDRGDQPRNPSHACRDFENEDDEDDYEDEAWSRELGEDRWVMEDD